MRTLFLVLVFPFLCVAEDSPFNSGPSLPEIVANAMSPKRHPIKQRGPDLSDWSALSFANQQARENPFDEPPIIIYHARDSLDMTFFQMQQNMMNRGNTYAPKPRIIYEIGEHGRR